MSFCDHFHLSVDYIFGFSNQKYYSDKIFSLNKDILRYRLKEVRKERKYTQKKIGELLNIDHSVWCRYERGVTLIPTTFLYIFCKTFTISADYLLGRTNKIYF